MANIYSYEYDGNLYINLTNKCTNDCVFCVRSQGEIMNGLNLWLDKEPTGSEVVASLKNRDLSAYNNVVFCGYGEPTANLSALLEVGEYLKEHGVSTRLNTNGHGNLINGTNIVPLIAPYINTVSVSLNDATQNDYNKVSRCSYGPEGFNAVVDFIKECKGAIPNVVATVVDIIPKEHIARSRQLAEELGVEFRVRRYTKY